VTFDDGGRPGAVSALDVGERRLVAWRDSNGELHIADARCPHQWADLPTEGFVLDHELTCRAHGWRFDADGVGSKVSVKGRRDPTADLAVHRWRPVDGGLEIELAAEADGVSTVSP